MREPKFSQEIVEGEMEYLQEEISCLAEDINDLDERQEMAMGFINDLSNAGLDMLSVVRSNSEDIDRTSRRIKKLEEDTDFQGDFLFWTAIIALFWNLLLTLHALNVF